MNMAQAYVVKCAPGSTASAALRALLVALGTVMPLSGFAADTPQPGEYTAEGGWGHLSIERRADGALHFNINSLGANWHSCELDGDIHDGRATLESDYHATPCVVSFAPQDGGVGVTSEGESCRSYCGMRAGFDGLYLRTTPACTVAAQAKARKTFKQLYQRKDYAAALATLEPVLRDCHNILHWHDEGWIRNDLAITRFKLGDRPGCLTTLEPLMEDARLPNEALRDRLPPGDAESYLEIIKATRTNLKLCTPVPRKDL